MQISIQSIYSELYVSKMRVRNAKAGSQTPQ